MDLLNDERLLKLNELGIIPGPDETAQEFMRRAEYCLSLKKEFLHKLEEGIPFEVEPEDNSTLLEKGCCQTSLQYDIAPVWVPIFFSNYQLTPWQGGCAWIFQAKEDAPTAALFQLRQAFKYNHKYLHIYDRDELITHELCHIGRMVFDEPKFEELLAYQTSSSWFRRTFGPIVQSSYESMIFVIVLIIIFITDFSLLALGWNTTYKTILWIKLLPLTLIGLACIRLWIRHRVFSQCLKQLCSLVSLSKARALCYRLQDQEIENFAKSSPEEIQKYAFTQAEKSLRWQLITKAYFQNSHMPIQSY